LLKKEKPGWFARFSLLAAGLRLQPRRQGRRAPMVSVRPAHPPVKNRYLLVFEAGVNVYMQTAYQSEIDEILYET
jgi:hypothetical protein